MTEHAFQEFGYLSKGSCEAIRDQLQGDSYMSFDISWSNDAGNCILVVRTSRPDTTEEELAHMFLACAMYALADLARRAV